MADFNPDAYIAKLNSKQPQGFDPDAYIKAKGLSSPDEQKPSTSAGMAGLESYGNALTSGYLPHLQAGAEKITDPLFQKITGKKVEPEDYVKSRDENIARQQLESKEHPTASMAGRIAGTVNQSLAVPLPGALAPKSLLAAIPKGAAVGAAYGLLQNPGDVKGEVNPIQGKERLENAKSGAEFGAIAGPATYAVSKGLGALKSSPEKLGEVANEGAVRQTGAMLKDMRQLEGKNETNKFGKFLRDKGLVSGGDTFEDVARKAQDLNKKSGEALESIYNEANAAQQSDNIAVNKEFQNLPEADVKKYADSGFSISRDKKDILSAAKDALRDQEGGPAAIKRLSDHLDNLESEYGGQILSPKKAQEIKSGIDKTINYSRNPLSKQPDVETAFSAARKQIADKIDSQVEYLANKVGGKGSKALREANRDYGYSKKALEMAKDYVNRQNANRALSLTDTIAGGAGGAIGSGIMSATGDHDPAHMGEGAIAGMLIGGAANHYGRQYGGGLISEGAGALSKVAPYTAAPIGKLGGALLPQEMMLRGLLNSDKNKK